MGRAKDITQNYEDRLRVEKDAQTVTQRCVNCEWEITATLGETRLMFAAHRQEHHPEAKQRTRFIRRRPGSMVISPRTLDENIAITRAQGGGGWLTEEMP